MDEPWFVYVVECRDGSYYCGITNNVEKRVDAHNTKSTGAKYTKTRRPVKLLKFWTYENKSVAAKEEYKFKKLTRAKKIERILG